MSQFLLLLHESPTDFSAMSPEEMQSVIDDYQSWSARMAEAGRLVAGHKLVDGTGRVLRGSGPDLSITDGPMAEAKEVIGGFFQIEAASYDEAVDLIVECPHLRYGGSIELRQIDQLEA